MVRRVSSLQTSSRDRRNRNVSNRYQLAFTILLFLFPYQANSQFAIGLYEGLMGNSGAALSDPTAPSYYNPSLLNRKKKDSYSLSGNTLGTYSAKSERAKTTSFNLNPGYVSTILVGTGLVHEIFVANTSPSQFDVQLDLSNPTLAAKTEMTVTQSQFLFGYSMAFRSIPFALTYYGQYTQKVITGFDQFTSLISNMRSTQTSRSEFKSIGTGIGVSGYAKSRGYTLGYQLRTRQLILYKEDKSYYSKFIHGGSSATDYTQSDSVYENQNPVINGSSFVIGHGFSSGDHEFITDSQLQETSSLDYSFKMTQTFGYRMNSKGETQLLVGFAHELGPEVKYFGQSAYYSAGLSWLKNNLRSVFGAYALSSRIGQDVFAAGLTFGSEFNY